MKRFFAFVSVAGVAVYGAVAFWSRNKGRVDGLDKPVRSFTKRAKKSLNHLSSDTADAAHDVRDSAKGTANDLKSAGHDSLDDAKSRLSGKENPT